MKDYTAETISKYEEALAALAPMLHGLDPAVTAAVLADLTAIWLAGFQGEDAEAVREALLEAHVRTIRSLIPVNEAIILERHFGRN